MTDESLEQKLIQFILHLTEDQMLWLHELRTITWEVEDAKNRTWRLFADAHLYGIRQSVAHPLVKTVVEEKKVEITAKELSARAFRGYGR